MIISLLSLDMTSRVTRSSEKHKPPTTKTSCRSPVNASPDFASLLAALLLRNWDEVLPRRLLASVLLRALMAVPLLLTDDSGRGMTLGYSSILRIFWAIFVNVVLRGGA
jgi:hypothetical protein